MTAATVVMSGWSGAGNLGDELLTRALIRRLAEHGVGVVATSVSAAKTASLHGVPAVGQFDVRAIRRALEEANGFVFGPGGILQDQTSLLSLPSHLWRVVLARRAGGSVTGLGLGAVPFEHEISKTMVRRVLSGVPLVVRDTASRNVLVEAGLTDVTVTADLVFGLSVRAVPPRDRLVVAPRPFSPGRVLPSGVRERFRTDPRLQPLTEAIDAAARRLGLPVLLLSFQPERDGPFCEAIAARLTAPVTLASPSLDDVFDLVGESRVVVAMRYHAAVAAVLTGRPAVTIGYSPKVTSLADDVGPGFVALPDALDAYSRIPDAVATAVGREEEVGEARRRLVAREAHNSELIAAYAARLGRS